MCLPAYEKNMREAVGAFVVKLRTMLIDNTADALTQLKNRSSLS